MSDRDAYEGAREDLLEWKGRALRAEQRLRAQGWRGEDASEPPSPAASDSRVPEGFVLVPREPTHEMVLAANKAVPWRGDKPAIYYGEACDMLRAMLSAAPAPAAAPRSQPTAEHWRKAVADWGRHPTLGDASLKMNLDWIEQRARELAQGDAKEEW